MVRVRVGVHISHLILYPNLELKLVRGRINNVVGDEWECAELGFRDG